MGCFIMGVLAQLAASWSWFNAEGVFPEHHRLLFAVGFCGSFTTLSALVFEINDMLQGTHLSAATAYFAASIIGGFACFYVGMLLFRT